MDPKKWTLPIGVELITRNELYYVKKTNLERRVQSKGSAGTEQREEKLGGSQSGIQHQRYCVVALEQEFLERAGEIFEQPKDVQDKDARIAELERIVGRLSMQVEVSKKAVSYASWLRKNSEE